MLKILKDERGIVASIAIGIATGVAAALGGGLLAGGIGAAVAIGAVGAAVWGATSLIGGMFSGGKDKQMQLQQTPGTPEYKDAKIAAQEAQRKRRLQIADAGGTSLTSPMGLTTSKATVERKTLLGS